MRMSTGPPPAGQYTRRDANAMCRARSTGAHLVLAQQDGAADIDPSVIGNATPHGERVRPVAALATFPDASLRSVARQQIIMRDIKVLHRYREHLLPSAMSGAR